MKYRKWALILPFMFAANASAQDIAQCLTLSDASARLNCFDSIHNTPTAIRFPQIAQPKTTVETPLAVSPQTIAPQAITSQASPVPALTPEEQFGKLTKLDNGPKQITSNIKSATFTNSGRVRVTLENGQVWLQTSSDGPKIIASRLKRQTSVVIKRGAFGSFRMKLEPWGQLMTAKRLE